MKVRFATSADAEALREIYNAEVTGSTATFDLVPRSAKDQRTWLAERSGARAVIVAESDEGVVAGYASLSQLRPKAGYTTSVENSVYVAANARGQGVGELLLRELLELARSNGFHTVLAHIVSDQQASIALHAKLGFEQVGLEKEVGRKFGRWLDVVVMQILL